jgi:hypothetical protein
VGRGEEKEGGRGSKFWSGTTWESEGLVIV